MREKDMQFGRVSPSEHQEVLDLLARCGLPTEDVDLELLRHFIRARGAAGFAGVVGIEPLDHAALDHAALGHAALLRSLAVAPDQRGLGVGSRLCDEAESLARAGEFSDLYLLTTTAADWFAARGYARVERDALPDAVRETREFRQFCPASAVAMHKRL
jgi:amino-acid N-acetyltransferase